MFSHSRNTFDLVEQAEVERSDADGEYHDHFPDLVVTQTDGLEIGYAVRQIVRDVVIDYVPLAPCQMLFGVPVSQPKLASIRSIAKVEHLYSQTLRNVLRVSGVIDDTTEHLPGARNIVADYSRVKALIELTKHAIPVSRVPDMLNTSHSLVSSLIELNQLTRIEGHVDARSKVGKAIDGRSIQRVMNFRKRNFDELETVQKGFVDLPKAAQKSRVSLNLILELLFDHHLKHVCRLKSEGGFGGLFVSPSEILEKIKDLPLGVSDEIRFWMG